MHPFGMQSSQNANGLLYCRFDESRRNHFRYVSNIWKIDEIPSVHRLYEFHEKIKISLKYHILSILKNPTEWLTFLQLMRIEYDSVAAMFILRWKYNEYQNTFWIVGYQEKFNSHYSCMVEYFSFSDVNVSIINTLGFFRVPWYLKQLNLW